MWVIVPFALADVLPPLPTDCPIGSAGRTSHHGPSCEAIHCEASWGCPEGAVCDPRALCIRDEVLPCGSNHGHFMEDCTFQRKVVLGPCGPGGRCGEGSCRELRVCVPRATASWSGACLGGCTTTGLGLPGGLALLVLGGLAPFRTSSGRGPSTSRRRGKGSGRA